MKNILFSASIFSVLVLASCTKNITIPQPAYDEKPSIQCLLEPGTVPFLYLDRSVAFLTGPHLPEDLFIRDALVEITDGDVTDHLQADSLFDRESCQFKYYYKGSELTKSDKTYQLSITLNGQTYTASTTTDVVAAQVDSVSYTAAFNDIYGEHEGVIVYFHDQPGRADFYRFVMNTQVDTTGKHSGVKLHDFNTCLGTDTIQVVELGRSVYNDQNLDGQQIQIIIEPAYSHTLGLEVTVGIESLDAVSADFLDQIDRQKLAQLNPFVEPVFLKDGQFGKAAIGFFGNRVRSQFLPFVFPE
ncbi:MAG: DUF4249 family protein [Bacteroidetes bacterium]|nr:DUF4249 family protein [Bacteroidota bacterium]